MQPAGARGGQTDHGGREELDSLSVVASRLPAVTQLSRAQLLLGSVAVRATLTLAGAVVATLTLGGRAMLHLGCSMSSPRSSRLSPSAVGVWAAQNGAGRRGGRLYGCSPLDGKLRPAHSLHLCPGGARAAPLRSQGLCGVAGAALAHPPWGAVGLGERCAPGARLPVPVAWLLCSARAVCAAWRGESAHFPVLSPKPGTAPD